ncbi:hypothetical protein CCP3SC15_2560002 [Gammaproteobacteria bacterium]
MTQQQRNGDMTGLLAGDFARRNDASFAWGNASSYYQALPGLRAYWPMGPNKLAGGVSYAVDVACGYHLALVNDPKFSIYGAVAPYIDFVAATSQELTYADDPQFDILGTEAYVASPGLTTGAWVWFDAPSMGAFTGLLTKYNAAGNQRAWRFIKTDTDHIAIGLSPDGIALSNYNGSLIVDGRWYFVAAKWVPGVSVSIWVNNTITTAATAVAALFNSTEPLRSGRLPPALYLDGRISHQFVCASALPDTTISALYYLTYPLFYGD